MPYSQQERLISITTPLGEDTLLLASFSGREALSRLFRFQLELLVEGSSIAFADIIGQNVTISIALQEHGATRYINGLVSQFAQSGADTRFKSYQMEVVPWTWMLTRNAGCKIYHNKNAGQILEAVFKDRGFLDYELKLHGSYPVMEYCVQYRETDFHFISRLMEQHGIFYFYKHELGKHTMIIADTTAAHEDCPGQPKAGYNLTSGGLDDADVIHAWSLGQELRSGKYSLTDWNFKTPSANLLSTESSVIHAGGNDKLEIYDYPGEYIDRAGGSTFVKLRMQEEEAGHLVATGASVCRAFTTGYKFDLTDHYQASMDGSYVLREIQHSATVRDTYNTDGGSGGGTYSNQFTCIPATIPFRPARITPKPFVQGPQTAIVVGASGYSDKSGDDGSGGSEDIWVDTFGRVIVRFPWDREGACSCRVRVSQDWAGQGWGAITIPRVGQEVIVSFLEGDPDRPIITGRVYNADQTVPYPLPANQTRSTFKTRSSQGGSTDNYNELRFEDKKDNEQIFLRGEKDHDNRVKNDTREWIGNNRSLVVTKDQMEKAGGDLHSEVTGNVNQKVGQSLSLQVGQNLYEKSGANFAHEAGSVIHLKAGTTLVLEAGAELTLKVGGNFIDINAGGVTIVGSMVMINSGGAAGSGCGSSPTSPKAPDVADDGSKGGKL